MPCIIESPVASIAGGAAGRERPRADSDRRAAHAPVADAQLDAYAPAPVGAKAAARDSRRARERQRRAVALAARRGDAELRGEAPDAPAVGDPHARPVPARHAARRASSKRCAQDIVLTLKAPAASEPSGRGAVATKRRVSRSHDQVVASRRIVGVPAAVVTVPSGRARPPAHSK